MKTALLIIGFAGLASAAEIEVTPVGQYVTVKGDENKYREYTWSNDGWTEGGDATLHQGLGKDATLDFTGHGMINDEDYRLELDITKKDVGYIRAGWTQYRHYYDGTGGFFRPFSTPAFTLNGDQYLDVGNIFVEVGLTLPKLPKITLGYERQYRDGDKSLLEWGSVTEGGDTRKIFPSSKDIDEHTDIFKIGIEQDIKNVHIADQFRYERYDSDTKTLDLNAGSAIVIREQYDHDAYYNTFQMDSHLKEHIYWSLGYLYTTLDGNAGLSVVTAPPLGPFDQNWATRAIDVGIDSHVVNANVMFGPYKGLTISAGVQIEKTESDGFSDALLSTSSTTTNLINTSNDKTSVEEMLGLRYTRIPHTTLYAEGRLAEQQIDLDEHDVTFRQQTDADIFQQDYRVGFNTSPFRRVTLSGRLRYTLDKNDYNDNVDTTPGYPGFITMQDFATKEATGKLTVRPCSRFSASLEFQKVATDIKTGTSAIPLLVPKGQRYSGQYDANIYSVSATVIPISRLYLTGLFSLQDTHTLSEIATYKGNVYTAIGTAGFALDNKSDITVEYSYSCSDNFRGTSATALPLGIDYHRHGLIAGISRKFTKHVEARLRYGWYEYVESSTGGLNNYRAQLASASCTVRF